MSSSSIEVISLVLPILKVVNVDTPVTIRSSRSVCPSTSRFPLASMLAENVDTPVTTKSSRSVRPSTSKLPFASILAENVDTPVTTRSSRSVRPSTSRLPVTVKLLLAEMVVNAPDEAELAPIAVPSIELIPFQCNF